MTAEGRVDVQAGDGTAPAEGSVGVEAGTAEGSVGVQTGDGRAPVTDPASVEMDQISTWHRQQNLIMPDDVQIKF